MVRTTITLDDDTAALLGEQVRRRGISFKEAVNDAVRQALAPSTQEVPYEVPVYDMGQPTVSLDRALALAGDLEDEELLRKARMRK